MKRPGFMPGLFLFKELPRRIWINRCVTPVDFGPMICGVGVRDIIRALPIWMSSEPTCAGVLETVVLRQ